MVGKGIFLIFVLVNNLNRITMKVYKMEFDYFDACEWGTVDVTLTAQNKFQLIKAFFKATEYLCDRSHRMLSEKDARKLLWNNEKKYIREEQLTFPIINKSSRID